MKHTPVANTSNGNRPLAGLPHHEDNSALHEASSGNANSPATGSQGAPPQQTENSSLIQTMEPCSDRFLRNVRDEGRKRKQENNRQRKLKEALRAQENTPKTNYCPKFYSVRFPRQDIGKDINVNKVERQIEAEIGGEPENIKRQNKDTLLITVKSELQGNLLSQVKTLDRNEVSVTKHKTLNESRGTVYSECMANMSLEELHDILRDQNVTKVERMKRKVGNDLQDTHRYILTFDTPNMPQTIKLASWHNELVEVFIPKPMRCIKCQKLGHTRKFCSSPEPTCAHCGQAGHLLRECKENPKCVNCGEAHRSSSIKCPSYMYKSEILATRARKNVTYGEAEAEVRERYKGNNQRYNFVVKRQLGPRPTADACNTMENRPQTATAHQKAGDASTAEKPPIHIRTIDLADIEGDLSEKLGQTSTADKDATGQLPYKAALLGGSDTASRQSKTTRNENNTPKTTNNVKTTAAKFENADVIKKVAKDFTKKQNEEKAKRNQSIPPNHKIAAEKHHDKEKKGDKPLPDCSKQTDNSPAPKDIPLGDPLSQGTVDPDEKATSDLDETGDDWQTPSNKVQKRKRGPHNISPDIENNARNSKKAASETQPIQVLGSRTRFFPQSFNDNEDETPPYNQGGTNTPRGRGSRGPYSRGRGGHDIPRGNPNWK